MTVTIDQALRDQQLLGAALGPARSTWTAWFATVKAAYGLPLSKEEREVFNTVAGGREPPTRKVKQLVATVSRRGGKGRMAGALAAYEAALVDHSSHLAPGEPGVVACVSPTRAQATIVKDYALGYFESSPVLQNEIEEVTNDQIRLKNGNLICTLANDYRSLRGRTLLLAILDEAAYLRDDTSALPDVECARALLPGLQTTGGSLCILSSPYRRTGLLYQRHSDFFGADDPNVLCVCGRSVLFNPTLSEEDIKTQSESDPEAALSEWQGEFRSDLSAFLDHEIVDGAIDHGRPLELPPRTGIRYTAFADPSGGRHDGYVIAIGHKEHGRFVADVIRGRVAPFDPREVTREFAELAKQYGCREIISDRYAANWAEAEWHSHGIRLKNSKAPASDLYLESLPLFTRRVVAIPNQPRLLRELRLLERRASRSGKDTVGHPRAGTDDFANALCGMLSELSAPRVTVSSGCLWMGYGKIPAWWGAGKARPEIAYEDPNSAEAIARREQWQADAASRNDEARAIILGRR